jgi:tetratricopeptide (TPR) repeat protein
MQKPWPVCVFLLLLVLLAFGRTIGHDFVNYDDNKYVYQNPHVTGGVTVEGIAWALTARHASNWHPVTWLSHMLDCQVYGLWAGGHHLTNVLLHAATAILLFLVLRQMTGQHWPSAFAAALFAIHPLRVESVAWVAERKDVLSGLFFMLTLMAYVRYARRPFSIAGYLAVLGLFGLGLMAKPMLVTVPLVLLLLDYWPLNRFVEGAAPRNWRLVVEKVPLLLMSAASCMATLWAQSGAIAATDHVAWPWRMGNAAVSYVTYLTQWLWPVNLAVLYPHPGDSLPIWKIVAAIATLTAISVIAVAWRRSCPYLLTGWFWYLVVLLPVIGLLQVGRQAMADRYTYLPQIGLCIAVVWGGRHMIVLLTLRAKMALGDLTRSVRSTFGIASAILLTTMLGCTWCQVAYWQDSETLWNRALACTTQNPVAHYNLGVALAGLGRIDGAMAQYRKAVDVKPTCAEARYNLAVLLAGRRRMDEAIAEYEEVLHDEPDFAEAHNNLGVALVARGRVAEAIGHYQEALRIMPGFGEAHNNQGNALAMLGRIDEAIVQYEEVLKINPSNAEAHNNLGAAMIRQDRVDEAVAHYRRALELKPDYAEAHNNLAVALQRQGDADAATGHYEKAIAVKPDYAEAHNNLGALLGQQGRMAEAVVQFQAALKYNPHHAGARRNLAVALESTGDIPDAAELKKR